MKKKVFSTFLAAIMLIACVPAQAVEPIAESSDETTTVELLTLPTETHTGYCGGEGDGTNLTWTLSPAGILTISGEGAMTDFDSTGSAPWADYAESIQTLVLDERITSIGSWAFEYFDGCDGDLTLPGSITYIGDYAFYGAGYEGELTIPSSVTYMGLNAFANSSIESVYIPASVNEIHGSFADCYYLEEIVVAKDSPYFTVEDEILYSKDMRELVQCPAGRYGEVVIPSTVKRICHSAFEGCNNLEGTLVIPDTVEAIEFNAFFGCDGFTSLLLGNGISKIDGNTFRMCDGLIGNIGIPASIKSIELYAFRGCDNLTGIYFYGNAPEIDLTRPAFDDGLEFFYIKGKTGWTDSDAYDADSETWNGYPLKEWDGKNIPGVTSGSCGEALTFSFENGVLTISGTGWMDDYDYRNPAPWSGYKDAITKLILEEGIESIGNEAFDGCHNLTGELNLPSTLEFIGGYAFYECGITGNLSIPDSVYEIGERAFADCYGLTGKLVLPNSLEYLGYCAFECCEELTGPLVIPASVEWIGGAPIPDCYIDEIIVEPGNQHYCAIDGILYDIDVAELIQCPSAKEGGITIPDTVEIIGRSAFEGCGSVSGQIKLPSSVNEIEFAAFRGSSFSGELVIPNGVEIIDGCAFEFCVGLNKITFSSRMSEIMDSFSHCSGLVGIVTIPTNIEAIAPFAFYECDNLSGFHFEGDAPEILWDEFGGSEPEDLFPAGVTLYYNTGTSGWTDSEYYDSEAGTWNGYKLVASSNPEQPEQNEPAGLAKIVESYPKPSKTVTIQSNLSFYIRFNKNVSNSVKANYADLDFAKVPFSIYRASDDRLIYRAKKCEDDNSSVFGTSEDISVPLDDSPYAIITITNADLLLEEGVEYYIVMGEGFIRFEDGFVSPEIAKGDWRFVTAIETSITIKNGFGNSTSIVAVLWKDEWFGIDATAYNHDLATASIALSGASYVNTSPKNLVQTLKELGFDDIVANYQTPTADDYDIVSYVFGTKEVLNPNTGKRYNLVSIIIKGTSANEEWYSNFNITPAVGDHAGFSIAAQKLMNSFAEYYEDCGLSKENTKVLVTGHSRGAAVANLVSARLMDDGYAHKENTYAYTFATPTVSESATETGYENIFNIISREDFISQVPLTAWGFDHYGTDLFLPSKNRYSWDRYSNVYNKMTMTFYTLTGEGFSSYPEGTITVDELIEYISELAKSRQEFYFKYYLSPTSKSLADYFDDVASLLVDGIMDPNTISVALNSAGKFAPITAFFLNNYAIHKRINCAHSMATYYSWMSSCSATELFGGNNGLSSLEFSRLKVACPVNVYIYDETGMLVASVVDEAVEVDYLAVKVENGIKTIDIPSDQKYSIKIVATDNGEMSYTIEERFMNEIGSEVLRTVEFDDLTIDVGDEFIGVMNDKSIDTKTNYKLSKNSESTIFADYSVQLEKSESDLSARINLQAEHPALQVVLASYGSSERLLNTEVANIDAGSMTDVVLPIPNTDEATTVKVFWLSQNTGAPVYSSWKAVLP